MLGIYFSGTGNTKHCVEYFTEQFGDAIHTASVESPEAVQEIAAHDIIIFGYPVYFSNTPKIVRNFILHNSECFQDKRVYIIATMALFSGDGAGCAARLLHKCNAEIIGGLHLRMPDCIGDEKILKKTAKDNSALIKRAELKIECAAERLKNGNGNREGLGLLSHIAGLLGQRLWFYGKTITYKKKPDVDSNKCIGCGKCAVLCPMNNIAIVDEKAVSHNRCTLCYRCFSRCPTQALTILGRQVHEQWFFKRKLN